jgi:hypothetical protein
MEQRRRKKVSLFLSPSLSPRYVIQPYAAVFGKKKGKRRAWSLSAASLCLSLCLFAGKKKKKRRSRKEKKKNRRKKNFLSLLFSFFVVVSSLSSAPRAFVPDRKSIKPVSISFLFQRGGGQGIASGTAPLLQVGR